jgi:hypothetical protein
VIVAVPGATAVTVIDEPEPLMDATKLLLLDQLSAGFVAFDGRTVALMVRVSPTVMEEVPEEDSEILLTNTALTVTETVSVLSIPPMAAAVIVAVPGATAVTVIDGPEAALMDATEGLLLVQFTVGSEAFAGKTVVLMVKVSPG